jgi:glucose/arabinose dehydrogenase
VGRIRIVRDGRLVKEPFVDVSGSVTAGGEQGLLGLAFHPDYEVNGRFFVNYTDLEGDTVVAEYGSDPASAAADPGSERVLLEIEQPFSNHNGGALEFGPDGYLYIATGDGGSGGDPFGNGQSLSTLLGKMLRIDVDGPSPYGIPADNPFAASDARREIWAYGLRNPWRFSFDERTMWIADVGQGSFEEINRMPVTRAGVNYGWNIMEGPDCYESSSCDRSGLARPITWYTHDEGCSVTGGYVYRGESFPQLQGTYIFGDYCSGGIWGVDADGPARQRPVKLLQTDRSISSFGLDERNELYLTDIGSGEVLQVTAGQ